jgi:septum formation protein
MDMNNNIILASGSPRRREILEKFGIKFKVLIPDVDELIDENKSPEDNVQRLSNEKADNVFNNQIFTNEVIIAADTIVSLDNRIFGKPADENEAMKMLSELSGKIHSVYTGVTVRTDGFSDTFFSKTDVEFYTLKEQEIKDYIRSGEPFGKAGAYAIQGKGALFIRAIYGDYYNVVGLPISELMRKHMP